MSIKEGIDVEGLEILQHSQALPLLGYNGTKDREHLNTPSYLCERYSMIPATVVGDCCNSSLRHSAFCGMHQVWRAVKTIPHMLGPWTELAVN